MCPVPGCHEKAKSRQQAENEILMRFELETLESRRSRIVVTLELSGISSVLRHYFGIALLYLLELSGLRFAQRRF